jgi:hypothetical protein
VIYAWLDMSAVLIFAVLVLIYGASGAAIYWLAYGAPIRGHVQSLAGVAAPFIATTGVLFGLLTGFLASDVGNRNRQAWRAVHTEASAATSLETLSIAATSDMAAIRAALRDYLQSVVTDEWPRMAEHGAATKTEAAQATLLREVSDPKIATQSGQAVHSALLVTVLRMRDARAERLALASDRTNDVKWITVLLLGMLTQVSIGLVHLERARAKVAAVTVFTVGAVITLGLLAIQEGPFDGPIQIPPTPIEHSLKAMATG